MKNYIHLLLAVLAALFVATFALAEDVAASGAPLSNEAQGFILSLLTSAVVKWPVLSTLVAFVGSMRLWAKPLFSLVHSVIELTPSKWDDDLWAKAYDFFTANPVGKTLAWLLDWLGSVKVVPPGAQPRQQTTSV